MRFIRLQQYGMSYAVFAQIDCHPPCVVFTASDPVAALQGALDLYPYLAVFDSAEKRWVEWSSLQDFGEQP